MTDEQEKFLSLCGWCGGRIGEEQEVFALGAKVNEEFDLHSYKGEIIPITLEKRKKSLFAMVPPDESEAKDEGKDLVFMTCSEGCSGLLRAALNQEIKMIETIF